MTIAAGTLGSLCGDINFMLGNRQDLLTYTTYPSVPNPQNTDKVIIWLKEAFTEICLGYRFEELEKTVNDQMVAGIGQYKLPTLARQLRSVTYLFPQSNLMEPRALRRRHIRNIRRYQTSQWGPPAIYAPYNPGGQPSIIVRPVPNYGYPLIWDIAVKPTFNADISATIIMLPDDWVDILKWSTVLRGHTSLLERDKAMEVQTLLFGGYDPALGRKVPGMIKQRIAARDQVDIEEIEYGLQPQVRRYTNSV
jgi:hypothetical protein